MYNQKRIYRVFQLINFLKASPPKSCRNLAGMLEISERSVYRYLDLLSEIGFPVIKDENGRYLIESGIGELTAPFTEQEIDFLMKMLYSVGNDNHLSQSIVQKISGYSEVQVGTNHVFKAHLARIIDDLTKAILNRKQVILKNYFSANSQSISDRVVEPFCFTDNYTSLSAFEPESMENKYFNIERISAVEILSREWEFEDRHEFYKPDVFGFQSKDLGKIIEMNLSLRACLLLKEEYPMSRLFIERLPDSNLYRFKTKVQDFKAPGRFVLGFPGEVEVIGSNEFLEYLNQIRSMKFDAEQPDLASDMLK
ncbi:MAG: HTH domain-containing protein [Flavobacteriales bacterium]|nr:HTH domain-containing protein [Flavobacteriales bacterium]